MWTDRYDPRVVREELGVLAAHGCNVTRSFCYWPDFVPEPERLDARALERFADFLDAHQQAGLGTIPTFIVGHMSGENWDPSWREGHDLYRDVWLVSQQAWFIAEMAGRVCHHPSVVGWLLSNEMPLYGGPGTTREVTAWARLLLQALRSSGATQPASVGDGAWGIEVTGRDNGYSLRSLSPLVDFLGPHVYPMSDDPLRQHLAAAFACEMSGSFGRPVILEEFGLSSDFAADEHAAHYYRQVLYSTLAAGATGWIAWNNTDYDDLAAQDPYRHHPFEMHFGLTDHRGRPKAALAELARFSQLLDKLPGKLTWQAPGEGQVRVVVPEHFERAGTFSSETDRTDIRDNLLQCYVAAREADLSVRFERERDGIDSSGRLYLLPSCKLITAPGAVELRRLAESGATVYYSYFPGSTAHQRGPWIPWIDELFGVRHQLRYGLNEPIGDDTLTLRFTTAFGRIPAGHRLELAVTGNADARTRLPLETAGAQVVAVDAHDRPALLVNDVGRGRAVLCAYPVEHMAARTPRVNPEPTWALYDALADVAGISRPLRCDDARVGCAVRRLTGADLAVVTNLSADAVSANLQGPGETTWEDVFTGEEWGAAAMALGPYQAKTAVCKLGDEPGRPPGSEHSLETTMYGGT